MEDYNPISMPILTRCKLNKDDESPNINQTYYMSMVCILLYVTTSRPDIMQVVGYVARFQATPKDTHFQAVKMIFKYFMGIMNFGLWYSSGKDFTLTAYTDAD